LIQGYLILRITFVVVPILSGLDKFFNLLVDWPKYLAPWVNDLMPGTAQEFMYVVGAIEIVAGIVVLISKCGSLLVAAWLAWIVVNILTLDPPRYYDIAARDFDAVPFGARAQPARDGGGRHDGRGGDATPEGRRLSGDGITR
jgi:DoxX